MHILHMIDADEGYCPTRFALLADLVAALDDVQQTVLVIGSDQLADDAKRVGLTHIQRIRPPLKMTVLAAFTFRKFLTRYTTDVICPWTGSCQQLANNLAPNIPQVWPDFIHPGVDLDRIKSVNRDAIRQQWQTDVSTSVLTLCGSPMRQVDAMLGCWVAGLACETGHQVKLLLSPNAYGLDRAKRMVNQLGHPERLIIDDRIERPWEVLPACDLALCLDSSANFGGVHMQMNAVERERTGGGLGLMWAMASGLAVIGEQCDGCDREIEHEETGLLVRRGWPRGLAQAVCRLIDDRELAHQLGQRSTSAIAQKHTMDGFAERMRQRFEQKLVLSV